MPDNYSKFREARRAGAPIDWNGTVIYETAFAAEHGIKHKPATALAGATVVRQSASDETILRPLVQGYRKQIETLGPLVRDYRKQIKRRYSIGMDHSGRNREGMDSPLYIQKYFGRPDDDAREAVANLATRVDVSGPGNPSYRFFNILRSYVSKLPAGARVKDCDQQLLEDYLNSILD